ncbi:UvrD-helicase domain-containing protein [Paradevosia shaoguanensis]|uniref:DNA 3'-5' helicase II n=1 Tax=Paradevosia shaoguanensis TaxID=1335043 RepID=A0AA41UAL8_9HYPH|nr:UvrD-helicase domain-containing protein [Paradevosia shaoguanensis]MCF1742040.1 ATP-dependent helicase [Paradevosia shaoguanensis]MCI0126523.1 ATP-dependent helicase [Paradevosia shaoguanensis]
MLAIDRGTVTAPAGCGKTHLIAEALTRHSGDKPVLVLTHTNAGVVALRGRLDKAGVPSKAYRLSTIDGWAMRLISIFPTRSGHDPNLLRLARPGADYPNIRVAAAKLLKASHVSDVLKASYARLIVDEYQDCSIRQHAVVAYAAQTLPTSVLGDPMQAIFGFGGDDLATWDEQVCGYFPLAGELATPWRWINAGAEPLGRWLLEARGKLFRGEPIDLRTAPDGVTWVHLDGTNDHEKRLGAARVRSTGADSRVLIIGDSTSPDSQRRFASQTPGAVTVEAVDLKDLVAFAKRFDLASPQALQQLAEFAQSVMRNVGAADFVQRVSALQRGTARTEPTEAEGIALAFVRDPSHRGAVDVLVEIGKQGGVTPHRPAVLRACIKALQLCDGTEGLSFHDAAIRMREQNRLVGRPLPKRAVGSTLLLKGLEAEAAVILNADVLDARNLYVAMTRGSQQLIVCSRSPILDP